MEKKINRGVIRTGETDIKVHLIDSFPNHPYHVFDDEDMTELAASIEANGLLNPIIVRSKADGRYELISGHRRKRAYEILKINKIRAIIVDVSDVKSAGKDRILTVEQAAKLEDVDCIIVLGCQVKDDGSLSHMLRDRLMRGLEVYEAGAAPKLLMSGDHGREDYDEVGAMKNYAIENGVPSENVFMDHAGFSTYETVYRAKEIFEADKVIIVTQEYHLYRALYIAEQFGVDAYGVSSDLNTYAGQSMRDFREVLARCKDWAMCIFKPEPTYLGEAMDVSVNLTLDGKLTCTYPAYNNGWTVTAYPDGTLTDTNGQTYNYLYWEGETNAQYDLSKGFCVKGEHTAAFLEDALAKLGLTRREANEFIVYWLPLMEQNSYNIISFQTDIYTNAAQLEVNPAPDTLIRVFMAWQASETAVDVQEQELTAPERNGFTVVEWGGTELK